MRTKLILTACVLCLAALVPAGCGHGAKGASGQASLVWRDAQTSRVLFTSDDVVAFDWAKQIFLLRPDAAMDFLAWAPPHMQLSRKLVVEDGSGVIYQATWVSPVASMTFTGPVYNPLSPNPFFTITSDYPPPVSPATTQDDARFAPRLRAGLESAGVLKSIDPSKDYLGQKIETTGQTWADVGDDLKVRVDFFTNTFVIGQQTRTHVFFAGGDKTLKGIDSLALEVDFSSNHGKFWSVA